MKYRDYPVPVFVASAHLGAVTTLDQLDPVASFNGDAGDWARRILRRSSPQYINRVTDSERRLPRGLIDTDYDETIVIGLVDWDGRAWMGDNWSEQPLIAAGDEDHIVDLTPGDVAFIVRAFDEGADAVLLHPAVPVARLDWVPDRGLVEERTLVAAAAAESKGYPKLPDNAKVVAVVDELDRNAVIELLAVLSGARVLRRHDGLWYPDKGWANTLKSVKPPPVVALKEPELRDGVITQVDEATKGQPFEETGKVKPPKAPKPRTGSGLVETVLEVLNESAADAFCWAVVSAAMQADIGSPVSGMPAKLQKYWAFGKGALKIRWGTPGAWTRCHRNLTKYVGPHRAKGTCTNLAKLRGGHGVATHVGD